MSNIIVNYEKAKENNVKSDARKATQIFLSGKDGTTLTIYPQALNPFLKAIESLGMWKALTIIPDSDSNNKPVYVIIKVGDNKSVSEIVLSEEE